MKIIKLCFLAVLSVTWFSGAVSVSAADSKYYAKAKEEGQVLLYTSLAGSDTKAFSSAFEKAYPGVKLDIYRASGTTFGAADARCSVERSRQASATAPSTRAGPRRAPPPFPPIVRASSPTRRGT